MSPVDSGLDLTYLRGLFPDDEDAVREILTRFVDPAGAYVAEIHGAVQAGDAAQAGAVGHKLKSAARAVGAIELADLCEALEHAGKAGRWEEIRVAEARLDETLRRVSEEIGGL